MTVTLIMQRLSTVWIGLDMWIELLRRLGVDWRDRIYTSRFLTSFHCISLVSILQLHSHHLLSDQVVSSILLLTSL